MLIVGLMLNAAFESFNTADLDGWASFFGHSHPLRAAAANAGVLYRAVITAETRMGSMLPFFAELADQSTFAIWRDYAAAHPPASARCKPIASNLPGSSAKKGSKVTVSSAATGKVASPSATSSVALAAAATEATRYGILMSNMNDVFTQASIIVLHELLNDLGPLLWASKSHVRDNPRVVVQGCWDQARHAHGAR
jgi:hypothetical protein